jgi:chromosome segregation protein
MKNRLESLELQGLKTFATTTRLEFPGKITAIVGPNGSGKSNIADAIRWVLGEQSFSLLRAKKTEDMIFSGSQQRSRVGMASSTITFNNEDGWLPIDYSHVAITRQAYRDGQNEYILNGQKVRLKDISELLAQTGLAERNYTIIGQGLVDVALALKPDERRKLFEEAAGIGLYRSRKEEAQRRLENTRKNLDRVLDILSEIKPRLRSLERQSQRFQEYQQVQSDLQLLLREWYGYQWHQKQQDLRNIRNAYQDQETRLHSLRKKHLEAETKVEETRTKLHSLRKALESNYGVLSTNHRELEQTTRELAILEERQRAYEQQKDNLDIDIANLQEEIKGLESQRRSLKSEVEQRQLDFDAAAGEAENTAQQLGEVSKEKDRVDSELSSLKAQRIKLETEKVQQTVRIDEHMNRLNTLNEERVKILGATKKMNDEVGKVNQQLTDLNVKHQQVVHKFELQQQEIKQTKQQLEDLDNKSAQISQRINLKENHRSKISTKLALLKEAESALSGYSEGSKNLVEFSRQGRLPKGIEPLSQHIVVDERYERAISAALGELTDLLVMPSQSKQILIEFLEAKENERVALVPIDFSQEAVQNQKLVAIDGVIGFANTLISVDNAYRNLVELLFADVLIVRDVQTAERIQDNLNSPVKVVTLSGLVFQPNGVIISGQSPTGKRIGRTRQQSELQSELEQIEQDLIAQVAERDQLIKSVENLHHEHSNKNQHLEQIDLEKQGLERELQIAKDSQARLGEQLTWHEDRLETLDINIIDIKAQIEKGQAELVALERQIGITSEEEQKITGELKDLPLFEMQQALNHWTTQHLIAQNGLESAWQRYQDNTERVEAGQQRLLLFKTRYEELEANLIEIEQKKGELKQSIELLQQKITSLEKEHVEPLATVSEQTEKSVSALQKLEAHSHQQVIIAERQYTQLQLELSRRKDQLDHLRERIEDDFGLVSFEGEAKYGEPAPLPFTDSLVEDLPQIQEIPETHEDDIKHLKNQLRRMGAINPEAQQEYLEVKARYEFLTNQVTDLETASKDLKEVIETLDEMMETDFLATFKSVNQEFSAYFSRLFNGGEAKLVFIDDENPVEGGVDIEARLPGRRQQGLALLSGGERSLTAVALIFALLKVSPPPFCILDEVDAMLDESNVARFVEELRGLAEKIQVVIITHNRNTVQAADVIYGVTMGRDSTSQMISLKLEEVGDTYFA